MSNMAESYEFGVPHQYSHHLLQVLYPLENVVLKHCCELVLYRRQQGHHVQGVHLQLPPQVGLKPHLP